MRNLLFFSEIFSSDILVIKFYNSEIKYPVKQSILGNKQLIKINMYVIFLFKTGLPI